MSTSDRWACVARMGGFGDNLIATSVFDGLKKKYDKLEVIASPPMSVMYENHPAIDKLTVIESGKPAWGNGLDWQKWFLERGKEYAFFANLSHSCEVTGVSIPIQTCYWWPPKMRRSLFSRSYLEIVHDICEVPYEDMNPNFYPTAEETAKAVETKAKIGPTCVGVIMAGSRLDKVHPHLDIVVQHILRDLNTPVILFGAPGRDREFAKTIESEVKKRLGKLDGLHLALSTDSDNPAWKPRRLMTQVQHCDLVLGPDTGPMWGVAMHALPKVLMASHAGGHNITAHWKNTVTLEADRERVPCYPCHRLHDDSSTCVPNADGNGSACISDISVETIVSTVQHLLKEQDNGKHQRICGKGDAGLGSGRSGGDPAPDARHRSLAWLPYQRVG